MPLAELLHITFFALQISAVLFFSSFTIKRHHCKSVATHKYQGHESLRTGTYSWDEKTQPNLNGMGQQQHNAPPTVTNVEFKI
jgi:hypothetical protein